jgi:hypothetical protein
MWTLSQSGALRSPVLKEFPELSFIPYVKPIENILPLSPVVGVSASSTHRVSSLRQDAKIEKFDAKT